MSESSEQSLSQPKPVTNDSGMNQNVIQSQDPHTPTPNEDTQATTTPRFRIVRRPKRSSEYMAELNRKRWAKHFALSRNTEDDASTNSNQISVQSSIHHNPPLHNTSVTESKCLNSTSSAQLNNSQPFSHPQRVLRSMVASNGKAGSSSIDESSKTEPIFVMLCDPVTKSSNSQSIRVTSQMQRAVAVSPSASGASPRSHIKLPKPSLDKKHRNPEQKRLISEYMGELSRKRWTKRFAPEYSGFLEADVAQIDAAATLAEMMKHPTSETRKP